MSLKFNLLLKLGPTDIGGSEFDDSASFKNKADQNSLQITQDVVVITLTFSLFDLLMGFSLYLVTVLEKRAKHVRKVVRIFTKRLLRL